jgi:hypothetical protein
MVGSWRSGSACCEETRRASTAVAEPESEHLRSSTSDHMRHLFY